MAEHRSQPRPVRERGGASREHSLDANAPPLPRLPRPYPRRGSLHRECEWNSNVSNKERRRSGDECQRLAPQREETAHLNKLATREASRRRRELYE